MTQEELAEKSGLSPRTIQAIERGRVNRPHRESVRLLAEALGLHGTTRAEFEAAARRQAAPPAYEPAAAAECPSPAECLVLRLRMSAPGAHRVDLRGLGHTAEPMVVLVRLLRAVGVDRGDLDNDLDRYGLTASGMAGHPQPVELLPGA